MINKLLVSFNRIDIDNNADLSEKIGNIGLGFLRMGFGKTVTVEKLSGDGATPVFTKKVHSTSTRVGAMALFILALPLTAFITGIGLVGTVFSKSHAQIYKSYQADEAEQKSRPCIIKINQNEKKSFPQQRKIPPVGIFDTIVSSTSSPSKIKSAHKSAELFSDAEIIEKLEIVNHREIKPGSGIYVSYTHNGKAIIQQQATRGCTAATAAMLILDNGIIPNLQELKTRNLGNTSDQHRDIENAGLSCCISPAKDLAELQNLILENDSCIVSVSGKLGGHVLIVDEVSQDHSKIRLRDPYHGWEITVSSEAFLNEWDKGKVIQILKPSIKRVIWV